MPGTREGGLKASQSNKQRYGSDFYKRIGSIGGALSKGGGFTLPGLAKEAGRLGGLKTQELRRKKRVDLSLEIQ